MRKSVFLDELHEAIFRREGYLILDLLTTEDIAAMRTCFDSVEILHRGPIGVTVLTDQLAQRKAIHAALHPIFSERLLPVLNDYRIPVTSFVTKEASCEVGKFPLHQDPSFIHEDEQAGISIWCPLDDVNQDNGNLGVVPYSHLLNPHYRTTCSLPYPDLVELIEEKYMRYLPMRAGQVLYMDHRMIHGSPTNRSSTIRVVAAGVGVPRQQQLLYCHVDQSTDSKVLEIHEVPDDFYLRNMFGQRPAEGLHAHDIPYQIAGLTPDILQQHCMSSP